MLRLLLCLTLSLLPLAGQQKKILVFGLSPDEIGQLRAAAPQARILGVQDSQAMAEIVDANAVIGHITPEMVRAGKKLEWFHCSSAGVENYLLKAPPDLKNSNITMTNARIIQGPEIADHAMALLLALTRGLYRAIPGRDKEEWVPKGYKAVELNGKTAVVIGVGGIGTQIATRASGFGMKVIGVDPKDLPYMPFLVKLVKPDQLDEVIPHADVVFISAPHTAQSEKMMSSRHFDMMKKGSYFIAVSRGKVYDMPGLVRALDSQRLAGAGVDVTDPEPLPKGHPLWKFDNAIITPHIATVSDQIRGRWMEVVRENVKRFSEGRPLLNVVDKQKGY